MASVATKRKPKAQVSTVSKPKLILPDSPFFSVKFEPKTVIEKLANSKDQKTTALELLGNLDGIKVLANKVLVCMYIEPDMRGSLYLGKETLRESVFQGTVGLVVKKGKMAFVDDEPTKTYFHGENAEIGEYVVFRAGDGKRTQIHGVDCKWLDDIVIDAVIDDPNTFTHDKI